MSKLEDLSSFARRPFLPSRIKIFTSTSSHFFKQDHSNSGAKRASVATRMRPKWREISWLETVIQEDRGVPRGSSNEMREAGGHADFGVA